MDLLNSNSSSTLQMQNKSERLEYRAAWRVGRVELHTKILQQQKEQSVQHWKERNTLKDYSGSQKLLPLSTRAPLSVPASHLHIPFASKEVRRGFTSLSFHVLLCEAQERL